MLLTLNGITVELTDVQEIARFKAMGYVEEPIVVAEVVETPVSKPQAVVPTPTTGATKEVK